MLKKIERLNRGNHGNSKTLGWSRSLFIGICVKKLHKLTTNMELLFGFLDEHYGSLESVRCSGLVCADLSAAGY